MYKNRLEQMTWQEAGEALKKCKVAILPLGSFEQHGPYIPVSMDTVAATEICNAISAKLTGDDVLILPPQPFGYCDYHSDFPGCIALSEATLRTVLLEIIDNIARWGVRRFIIVNGHGGNSGAVKGAAHALRIRGIAVAMTQWWDIAGSLNKKWGLIGHCDINELSAMLKWRGDWCVKPPEGLKDPVQKQLTDKITINDLNNIVYRNVHFLAGLRTKDVTDTGALWEYGHGGEYVDIAEASAERIEECLEKVVDYYLDFIEEFKKVNFEPCEYPVPAQLYNDYK